MRDYLHKSTEGDVIKVVEEMLKRSSVEHIVLAHGCNCFATMGAGVAFVIAKRWPGVKETDAEFIPDNRQLGDASFYNDGKLIVANMYTQYYFGNIVGNNKFMREDGYHAYDSDKLVMYDAVDSAALKVANTVPGHSMIVYPSIGAGLAKGNWNVIHEILLHRWNKIMTLHVEYKN